VYSSSYLENTAIVQNFTLNIQTGPQTYTAAATIPSEILANNSLPLINNVQSGCAIPATLQYDWKC
jgi:hypothetical protein